MSEALNDRLEALRKSLNLNYKELADMLHISRPMLDFLRSGKRKASPKVMRRIEELERDASYKSHTKADDSDMVEWLSELDVLQNHIVALRQRITARLSRA